MIKLIKNISIITLSLLDYVIFFLIMMYFFGGGFLWTINNLTRAF